MFELVFKEKLMIESLCREERIASSKLNHASKIKL